MAQAIRELQTAIADSVLDTKRKGETLDQLEELGKQATLRPEQRCRPSVIKAIAQDVASTVATIDSIAQVWARLQPVIWKLFGM